MSVLVEDAAKVRAVLEQDLSVKVLNGTVIAPADKYGVVYYATESDFFKEVTSSRLVVEKSSIKDDGSYTYKKAANFCAASL